MTKLRLITGDVYTELSYGEVRTYLQGGVRTGTFSGYLDEEQEQPIEIAVHSIEYIYKF